MPDGLPEVTRIEFFYKRDGAAGGDMYKVYYKNAKGNIGQSHHIARDELEAYKKFLVWAKRARYV